MYHTFTKPLYLGSSFESSINWSKDTSGFFCVSNSQLEIIALEEVTTVFTQLKTNIAETYIWGYSKFHFSKGNFITVCSYLIHWKRCLMTVLRASESH